MTRPVWLAELSALVESPTFASPPAQLAESLYVKLHCRSDQTALRYRDHLGAREFARQLHLANDGVGPWQPGWVVRDQASDGRIVAEKYGVRFWVPAEGFRPDDALTPGATGSVRLPSEFRHLAGSFYMVLGNTDDELDHTPLVRVYWHLAARGAVLLTRGLTRRLNDAQIPFRFKVGNDPLHFCRTDVAVLYLTRARYPDALGAIAATYAEVMDHLRSPVSAYVRQLAPGLGLAEDPQDGSSFGQHRSRLLAAGLTSPAAVQATTVAERELAVLETIRAGDIDPAALHLDRGSIDHYPGLPTPAAPVALRTGPEAVPETAPLEPAAALEIAKGIADHLCHTAIWNRDRCTWLGTVAVGDEDDDEIELSCATLGPSVYDGNAGVALFLSETAALTRDPVVARTAAGALAQALATRWRILPEARSSFYSGFMGLGHVALRAGQLLDRPDFVAVASELADEAIREAVVAPPCDVVYGLAGAIPALLVLSRALDRPDLGDRATEWGRRVVAAAAADAAPGRTATDREPRLTGFAHGAAGIGWALYELFAATKDLAFQASAEEAFRYEERWLQPDRNNWGDLRDLDGDGRPRCMTAWCHGAPGIGLARLRAIELGSGDPSVRDAAIAVRAAVAALAPDADPDGDSCLCHGWAGIATFLLRAGEVLGDREARQVALRTAGRAARPARAPDAWPVGFGRGSNPSLMVGLAGVGYFYLRLANPGLPSVLTPGAGPTA